MRHYNFNGLVGNSTTIHLLKKSLKNRTFRRFTIFGGVLGTGKSTTAGIVAMALTCESPIEGLPCGECVSCRANQVALGASGSSARVKVVNIGKTNDFSDIRALIDDVFILQGGHKNQVYIFEEAHALKGIKGGFTAFLSEIDRMPDNVYIIMCTTKLNQIPDDLRSRAVQYNFARLTKRESMALAEAVADRYGFRVSRETLKMVVSHSKGIPREIEKLITMIIEDSITEEELKSYLQIVSDAALAKLFYSFKNGDLLTSMVMVQDILNECSPAIFIEALKEFILKVVFLIEGGINEDFGNEEKAELLQVFDSQILAKVVQALERLSTSDSEAELKLAIIKLRNFVLGRTENAIIAQNASVAAKDSITASREVARTKPEMKGSGLTPLKLSDLEGF